MTKRKVPVTKCDYESLYGSVFHVDMALFQQKF